MPTATAPAATPASAADKPKPKKPKKPKAPTAASGEQSAPTPAPATDKPAADKPAPAKKAPAKPKDPKPKPESQTTSELKETKPAGTKKPKSDAKTPKEQPAKKNGNGSSKASVKPQGEPKAAAKCVKANGTEPDQPKKVDDATTTNGDAAKPPLHIPKTPVSLQVFNSLDVEVCAILFGNLLDFTPSVGYALAHMRPYKNLQQLVEQLNSILDTLPTSYLQGFLKRFNELGLVTKSKLTKEHKSCAGLEKLTGSVKEELTTLYSQYREKFGFPFVVCARGTKADDLPSMVRTRLQNDAEKELLSGVQELKKIAIFRMQEAISA